MQKMIFESKGGNLPLIPTLSIHFLLLMKSFTVLLMGHFILSNRGNGSKILILNSFYFLLLEQNMSHQDLTFSLKLKVSEEGRKINLLK